MPSLFNHTTCRTVYFKIVPAIIVLLACRKRANSAIFATNCLTKTTCCGGIYIHIFETVLFLQQIYLLLFNPGKGSDSKKGLQIHAKSPYRVDY